MMGDTNQDLDDKPVLYRDKELLCLKRYFLPRSCVPYPSLFISGLSSTGKTYILSHFLSEYRIPFVWINCYETSTSQRLYASVVEQLSRIVDLQHAESKHYNSFCDLVNLLAKSLEKFCETVVFVFDNIEAIRNQLSTLLPNLLRLQELTMMNLCTVLVSDVIWDKFQTASGMFLPMILHFQDYSKSQLVDILNLDCPANYTLEFYNGYTDIILKVFYVVTRNANELRHIAKLNFCKYCEPVTSGETDGKNYHLLFKKIEPVLKEAIHAVYLREVSALKWNVLLSEGTMTESSAMAKHHMVKELPFYSKFLLIACYFASYNLPKNDFKHFVKNQGKQRKKSSKKKTEKNRHLLGPKAFAVDRMLSIFYSIVGHGVVPTVLIHSQITSLTSLQLISCVTKEEQLNVPKYKCSCDFDLVRNIGKTVNIDITDYLDDFL